MTLIKTLINVSSTTCFSLVSLCEQFLHLYITDYHVVERALKEQNLIANGASPGDSAGA